MKIIDISQEIFSAEIFPGDPVPGMDMVMSWENDDVCQLTELTLGSHTGTHMDAPRHFLEEGRDVAEVALEKCVGVCKVVEVTGEISGVQMEEMLADGTERLLLKGKQVITEEAARVMAEKCLKCIGVEGLTVGPFSSPAPVHKILLGSEIVILEGLRLDHAAEGEYFLAAQPLKMKELDGSPVRAVLIDFEK